MPCRLVNIHRESNIAEDLIRQPRRCKNLECRKIAIVCNVTGCRLVRNVQTFRRNLLFQQSLSILSAVLSNSMLLHTVRPITVAERFKARVWGRPLAVIAGSIPVCCQVDVLRRADPSSREVIPSVACYCVWFINLKNEAALARVGLLRHRRTRYTIRKMYNSFYDWVNTKPWRWTGKWRYRSPHIYINMQIKSINAHFVFLSSNANVMGLRLMNVTPNWYHIVTKANVCSNTL